MRLFEHLAQYRNRLQNRDQESGFTLVEITVVVTLLGIVMPIIAAILYTSINTQNTVVSQANGQIAEGTVRDVLAEDVRNSTWMSYGYEFADMNNVLAMHINDECIAWRVADNQTLQRTTYSRASGPTNISFNRDGISIIEVSDELSDNQFNVTPSGDLQYTFTVIEGEEDREIAGTLSPQVLQNSGKAEGTCFRN